MTKPKCLLFFYSVVERRSAFTNSCGKMYLIGAFGFVFLKARVKEISENNLPHFVTLIPLNS